jgi:hypothetical protein
MKKINNNNFKFSRNHDLINELSKMNKHNYEDFLEDVTLDFSSFILGYVLDEKNFKGEI